MQIQNMQIQNFMTTTDNLVVGDIVAFDGRWQEITEIDYDESGEYDYVISFGDMEMSCTYDASWRVKVTSYPTSYPSYASSWEQGR